MHSTDQNVKYAESSVHSPVTDSDASHRILALIPQQHPFRFIDAIYSVDSETITGACRFSEDAFFYEGHFPGRPVTPGVILLETMAQTGVVAHGIFLMLSQGMDDARITEQLMLFAYAERVRFERMVAPGMQVLVRGSKQYFRRGQLKSEVVMTTMDGAMVCSGVLAGKGVAGHAE